MRKLITSALAGVVAVGAVLATAAPANADDWRYRRYHHRDKGGDAAAAAIIGGVAGLALGAALSNGSRRDRGYYSDGYYRDSYYGGSYYGGGGYYRDPRYGRYSGGYDYYDRPYGYRERTCVVRDRVYDPYIDRRVTVERRYRC